MTRSKVDVELISRQLELDRAEGLAAVIRETARALLQEADSLRVVLRKPIDAASVDLTPVPVARDGVSLSG